MNVFDTLIDHKFNIAKKEGDLAEATAKNIDLGKSIARFFVGLKKPQENTLKTNLLPQFRKFLADNTGIPFDACDKAATTPEPAPTCSSSVFFGEIIPEPIPYGQTAQYKITYCDPRIDNIIVELETASGTQTKIIPISSPSGTVSVGIRNKPNAFGDCSGIFDDSIGNFKGLSIVAKGRSGSGDLIGLGNFTNFRVSGNLRNGPLSSACDAELV
ncbi:hypothetical protein [Kamptonema sp. UHCC 0994]|uniref:hypothetical protein n=1 Tax=Kamptonema sp. UHCC 0994 TaxID=3031329 RepID=UPI0023BA24C1|nr:hypothetical protein [Kamptonema sp. UHCC 0994]MDF0554000.1 hypothetical protein [Kamptonema sp. UHCC 0994]